MNIGNIEQESVVEIERRINEGGVLWCISSGRFGFPYYYSKSFFKEFGHLTQQDAKNEIMLCGYGFVIKAIFII